MKKRKGVEGVMNAVIYSSLFWYYADPNITLTITKIHLILTALFIAYKLTKK